LKKLNDMICKHLFKMGILLKRRDKKNHQTVAVMDIYSIITVAAIHILRYNLMR